MERLTRYAPMPYFGELGVTVTPRGLVAVHWPRGQALGSHPGPDPEDAAAPLGDLAAQWLLHLREYLEGRRRAFPLPIDWTPFTPFRRAVMQAAMAIPYGEVRTYSDLAAAVGRPGAARAVGRVMATNPMPLVVPCHRVVGRDGGLHGYGGPGGLSTKAWLLRLEGVNLPEEVIP